MSEGQVTLYDRTEPPPACAPYTCPRVVDGPYSLPALRIGPWGEEVTFPALRRDGTLMVWHLPGCAAIAKAPPA